MVKLCSAAFPQPSRPRIPLTGDADPEKHFTEVWMPTGVTAPAQSSIAVGKLQLFLWLHNLLYWCKQSDSDGQLVKLGGLSSLEFNQLHTVGFKHFVIWIGCCPNSDDSFSTGTFAQTDGISTLHDGIIAADCPLVAVANPLTIGSVEVPGQAS
ncbi:MAG: hypothetical protein IPI30_21760 [Saprospiraceae bacterium]|nr:hypothetical protein [Candidatus Vicinibacter affinis]